MEGKEVEFTIEVSCRKGEPEASLGMTALSKAEGDAEDGEAGETEVQPAPTFEELGCTFNLTLFDQALTSEVLTFTAEEQPGEEEAAQEDGEEETSAPKEPRDPNLWVHKFTATTNIDEDAIVKICREVANSIVLNKAGLDVPLVMLPIDLCGLVAGEKEILLGASLANTELYDNPFNIADFSVRVAISEPLLTPELEEKLNPLCITIVAAEDMPDHPKYELGGTWQDGKNPSTKSLSELRESCLPVYCKYRFMQPPPPKPPTPVEGEEPGPPEEPDEVPDWCVEVVTNSLPQSKKVKFKHKKVFLIGLIHPDDLIQHLKDNKITVEVHDRDRLPPAPAQEEGEAGEAGGKEGVPVWSGLASIDKARAEEPLLLNPYAVCSLSLAPLCDGRTFVVERNDLWPKRIDYPAFSAHIKPTLGDYTEHGSVLVVKAELRRSLRNSALFPSGPFQRVVYRFPYSNAEMLTSLHESIVRINAAALSQPTTLEQPPTPTPRSSKEEKEERQKWEESGGVGPPVNETIYNMVQDGAPPSMLEKALNGVEISAEQARDPKFDIITGVEVIDHNFRIFILEGLAAGGILKL